jgi:BCS1 N terminal
MQGVGVGITVLRRGAVLASVALRRRLLVTLEINNKDRAYDWFLAWLAHHQRTTRRPTWAHSHQLSVETAYAQHKNGSADVLFRLVAGPGVHWLKYRGAWMQVTLFFIPPPLLLTKCGGGCGGGPNKKKIVLGETRARNARDADGIWNTMGNGHTDGAIARPYAIPAVARRSARCCVARAGRTSCRAYGVGHRVAPVWAPAAQAAAAQRRACDRRS